MKNESSAKPEQLDRPALGIMLRILSGALFAAMAVFVKAVSADVPVGQIVFFRSAFALAPLVCFLWIRGEFPGGLATRRPHGVIAGSHTPSDLDIIWKVAVPR